MHPYRLRTLRHRQPRWIAENQMQQRALPRIGIISTRHGSPTAFDHQQPSGPGDSNPESRTPPQ
ncbi:hypothetical protein XMIN_3502 [Xanthomonas citri pv. mangiferaeindicae LMG 941]|nr:hypothetical protein XMIN_3502 [Xanthomonas citri pv. mangiferaeindicae LMG 941]